MRKIYTAIILSCLVFACGRPALALDAATQQHIQELQQQIDALEAQASQYRNNIADQQAKADSLKREIAILQGQIGAAQAQIQATSAKIDQTQLQIGDVQGQISQTKDTISAKREAIGRMILFLDGADHESLLATLFKYANLSDFLSQLHDLSDVQEKVMSAVVDLKAVKLTLESQESDLQTQQDNLQGLKDQAAQQKSSLDGVKAQKNQLLKVTKGQEALYQKQLADVEKKKAAFFNEMQQLESQVISGGLYIVHVTATSVPARNTSMFIRPEAHTTITQGYGMTAYARRGAYGGAPHNGIDFSAGYGTSILAIGDGTIIARGTNDGWGNWVAIQHPNNLVSIYGHMSSFEFSLKVGSAVSQGQVIGYEGNTGNATGSHVHLSIYKDFFTYVNDKNGQLYFNYFEGSLNPLNYLK